MGLMRNKARPMCRVRKDAAWVIQTVALLGTLFGGSIVLATRALPADPVLHTIPLRLIGGGPIAVDDRAGLSYVVTADNLVAALTIDGDTRYIAPVGQLPVAFAVDAPHDRLFVASAADNSVSGLDSGGALRFYQPVPSSPAELAVDRRTGHLFVDAAGSPPDGSGTLSMFDVRNGRLVRREVVDGGTHALRVDEHTNRVFLANLPGSVSTFDASSGALVRTTRFGGRAGGGANAMALDTRNDRLYLTSDGGLRVLDGHTGTLLHTIPLGASPAKGVYLEGVLVDARHARAVVLRGRGRATTVLTLALPSCRIIHRTNVGTLDAGSGATAAMDQTHGRFYLADQRAHRLLVFDVVEGILARAIHLDGIPLALGVDERRSLLYLTLAPPHGEDSSNGISTVSWWQRAVQQLPWVPGPDHHPSIRSRVVEILDPFR